MHYLECIALLNYLQKKLCAGQRTQVPASVVDEVQTTMIALNQRLEQENDINLQARIRDTMEAVYVVKNTQGLIFLTDSMKNSLVSGVSELMEMICMLAFRYYQLNDFEPTEQLIPVLRKVVEVALQKGAI